MEDNLQIVFSTIISILVFFILPMYVAFEKKDDIAYALALRITSEFVENVKNNGYISSKMYDDYLKKLESTGNMYEISMQHKSYKYYPVVCSYTDYTHNKIKKIFEYNIFKNYLKYNGSISYEGESYGSLVLSYSKNLEVYTEKNILNIFNTNGSAVYSKMSKEAYNNVDVNDIPINHNIYGQIYTMNKGDIFTIILKNTNITIAETFFNTFTAGIASEPIPRIYINYGCTIQDERYKD